MGSRDANAIFRIDPASGDVRPLVAPGAGGLRGPAGMAFGPDGKLYVCSREARQILRFDAATGMPDARPFITDLPDFPEFIALVDPIAEAIPLPDRAGQRQDRMVPTVRGAAW